MCGELVHIRRQCLLNYSGPARMWWAAGHDINLHPPTQGEHRHYSQCHFLCLINHKPVGFLLDSGAAISVIHHTALPGDTNITGATTTAVSATDALLDTYHRLSHTFSLHYTSSLLFITLPWIVCWVPTFYNNTKLLWTVETICCIFNQQAGTIYHSYYPGKTLVQYSTAVIDDLTVESPVQIIIPGHTVQFITGKLNSK